MMGEEELRVGMMTKRAQQRKSIGPTNYKERVFVLTPGKLSYYEGNLQQRGKIKGSVAVNSIQFVGVINDSSLHGTNVFQICHNNCYLYCCATGQRDRDEWIAAIKQACTQRGNSMRKKHHPKIYSGGKWQCCSKTEKNAQGCQIYDDERMNKPLPSVPGLAPPPLPFGPQQVYRTPSSTGFMNVYPSISNDHQLNDEPPPVVPRPSTSHQPKLPPLPTPTEDSWQVSVPQHNLGSYGSNGPSSTGHRGSYNTEIDSLAPSYDGGTMYPKSSGKAYIKSYEHTELLRVAQTAEPTHPDNDYKTVTAIYDFKPQEHGDVPLVAGEFYKVLDTSRPHWWKVRDVNGLEGYIPANYVKECTGDGLETQMWFQKDLSRQRAEYLLKQDGKEGSFVIRNSSQPSVVYTLSVVSKAGMINGPPIVKHYHIRQNDQNEYYLHEKHPQPDIMTLITYHKHNAGGLVTRLRQAPQAFLGSELPPTHLFSDSKWEIDINELTFDRELGSGQFGVVRLGKYRGRTDVALKIMKEGTMEEDQFIEEAEVMTKLVHPNLVELYGVVTRQRPICIVTEFMEGGCLLDYIRKRQDLQTHPDVLLDMCLQVCAAMKYLESQSLIHRDLAARNCLVGRNNTIKVADFGLTRYVLDDEYTSSLGSKFPIKWAAPEVLNYTRFSTKSDVWAFGVLMWELFSGGKTPYRALSNSEVVDVVARGRQLERPGHCPHDVYSLMRKTWEMEPEKRPTFEILCDFLLDLNDNVSASCIPEGMYDA